MNQRSADLILLLVVLIWGSSYLAMKWGMISLGIFSIITLRFGIAFCIGMPLIGKHLSHIYLHTLISSAILGFCFFCGFTFLLTGMKTTTTTSAGFLMATTALFVPLLQMFFFHKFPNLPLVTGILLSVIGVGLLTLRDSVRLDTGAVLCLIGAVCYAVQIVTTKRVLRDEDALTIGVLQLGFAGFFALIFTLLLEMPIQGVSPTSTLIIIYLAIFCTLVGFVFQTIAQEYTSPEHTGQIYTLESVFAALFGFVFLQEILPAQGYIGIIFVFSGVIIAVRYGSSSRGTRSSEHFYRDRPKEQR
jgi:drug/metabolite transporter (DMT)-like permease